MDHPRSVDVRESAIVPKLDAWLATLFDPEATCEALAAAGGADDIDQARTEAATRKLADCDERLAKYRKALDTGADPVVVAGWMSEVQGERNIAEARPSGRLSVKQVRKLVASLQDVASVLATADPKVKAAIYRARNHRQLRLGTRIVTAEARPHSACTTASVGGGT
jgi:site-specific DNA recombinase